MKKTLVLLVLGMFITGCSIPALAETADTSSKPQRPQFENGERPQFEKGQRPQFDGKRPKFKPDSQPGGKMEPKEWDSSSDGNFQKRKPPEMKDGLKEGLKDGLVNDEQKSE